MPYNIDLHTHSFFSGDGVNAVKDTVGIADIDEAVAHARRRLERGGLVAPLLRTLGQIERVQVLVKRSEVDDTIFDGGGAFDCAGADEKRCQYMEPQNRCLVLSLVMVSGRWYNERFTHACLL